MKPAFALDFRDDAIMLLHRTGGSWNPVGQSSFAAPDLAEALSFLRSTALGLSPRGLSTKLIIPNDQILYLRLPADGPDDATRVEQIKTGLVGRTPYAIEELVFDWKADGPEVDVAVIARETLDQAEAFAQEHRFNPVSFVAVPDKGSFKGEPWFGPTSIASSFIADGEAVERDTKPVNIVARSFPTATEPKLEVVAAVDVVAVDVAAVDVAAEEPAVQDDIVDTAAQPNLTSAEPTLSEAVFAEAEATEVELIHEIGVIETPQATESFADVFAQTTAIPVVNEPDLDLDMLEAPMALDVEDDAPRPPMRDGSTTGDFTGTAMSSARETKNTSVLGDAIEDDLPEDPSDAALTAFASRRGADLSAKPMVGVADPRPGQTAASGLGAKPALNQKPAIRPAGAAPIKPAIQRQSVGSKGLKGLGALVTAQGIPGLRREKPASPASGVIGAKAQPAKSLQTKVVPQIAKTPSAAKAPNQSLGLGGKQYAQQRGKPRFLGLILTAVLLIFLVIIAAWSSYYIANRDQTPAIQTGEAVDSDQLPTTDDEMLADMQDPDADVSAPSGDASDLDAELAQDTLKATPQDVVAADSLGEPAPQIAGSTDTPQSELTTVSASFQDEILLASVDAPPSPPDPLALTRPEARGDPVPMVQAAPPPYGTVYKFDANGLIVPTPEGIITPEGVMLFAGKPPVVPAPRSDVVIAAVLAAASTAPATAVATDLSVPATLDPSVAFQAPALVGKRSKPRPEGLVVPLSTALEDQTSLAPEAGSRVASLRPKLRPAAILSLGDEARLAAQSASLALPSQANADGSISPTAVAISRKPQARPQDMTKAVNAAIAAALQQPEPEVQGSSDTADTGHVEAADQEPEVTASTSPKIPTKASVAKNATFKNAINLSKPNLIGVYGTKSQRYALVRQANGRYKKVKVGDSFDGGKIAAITTSELRYNKGGRIVILEMPAS